MLDRIVGWFETFIGVVESGGVEGADTGGLGLATLVSNGLQVVMVGVVILRMVILSMVILRMVRVILK